MTSTRQLAAILFTDIVDYTDMMQMDEAKCIYNDLLQQSKIRYVPAYDLATISVGLGNVDQAMVYLNQAFINREPWMPFIDMNPLFDSLKDKPEFKSLVKKIEE